MTACCAHHAAQRHAFSLACLTLSPRSVVIRHVIALDGDLVCEILRIVPYAPNEAGASPRQPGQAEEVYARLGRDAALMLRPTIFVESVDLQPAVIRSKTCRPDGRRNSSISQIERENGILHTVRIRHSC